MSRPRVSIINDQKVCPKCKVLQPLSSFPRSSQTWYGHLAHCKTCVGQYTDRIPLSLRAPRHPVAMFRRRYTTKGIELFGFSSRQCSHCSITLTWDSFRLALNLPLSRGGLDDWSNTVVLCEDCSRHKGLRTLEEWRHNEAQSNQANC